MSASASPRNGKLRRVLVALAEGRQLDRFVAAADYADSTLNSTISALQIRHGLHVEREVVKARNAYGSFWHCRYWLSASEQARARAMLARGAC